MTRVLFWTEHFWPYVGGVEVWSARLLAALQDRGYAFTVITSHGSLELPDTVEYKGIRILRFPFWKALLGRNMNQLMDLQRQVAEVKRAVKPNLIHINLTGPMTYFHLQTAHAHPAPLLISYHHPLRSHMSAVDSIVGIVLRSADWVNCFTATVLAELRQLVPEITPHSSVIYHGLEAPALRPEPLPFNPPRLLCLGRLVPEKGFDVAVGAFATIADRFPHARLVIASDGPARLALEQQAAELGLTDHVDFLGWVEFDRMPALLNSATMVVMPSRHPEGFGLVALEAALMARPVVATRAGGLAEVVVDGQTGLVIEKEDKTALAEAISYLLERPETAARMGHVARTRAQDLFTWPSHVDAFDTLYRQIT